MAGWLDGLKVGWLDGLKVGWQDIWMVVWLAFGQLDRWMVVFFLWLDDSKVGWLDVGWFESWIVGC